MIERLALIEGDTPRVEAQRLYVLSNLGAVSTALRDWTRAQTYLAEAAQRKLRRLEATPDELDSRISTANSFKALGALRLRQGDLESAVADQKTADSILGAANLPTDDFVLTQQIVVNLRSLANASLLQGDIATATDYLRDGKALADQLSAREPSNVDFGFEQLQLDITAFHLAFMREDSARAEDIYATLRAVIDTAPEAMNDDFLAASVRRLIQPFPLYLAILSDGADRRIDAATTLRTNLALPPSTDLGVNAPDNLLLPDLLSQFVLLPGGQAIPTHPLCAQTDFTYFKIIGWGWVYLSTILDDFSRYIIRWKLCTTMKTSDVTETLNMALDASGCNQANVVHKPRLLSDNGASYISGELADYVKD